MSELEEHAKYSAKQKQAMVGKGHAMKNDSGDPSYPIGDVADLKKAIMAVGRGGADHDAIRAHIIKNAARLGASNLIPDNWNADGSLKQDNALTIELDGSAFAAGIKDSIYEKEVPARRKPRHRAMPLVPEYRRGQGLQVRRFDMADSGLEVREAKNGSLIEVSGVPIRYNAPYTVRDAAGEFEETMEPGVVTQLLARGDMDCRFLFNHDGLPLARTTSGTLSLRDSAAGLQMKAQLDPRQQIAQDLAVAIERGDVTQMSCGFIVADDSWFDSNGHPTSPNLGVNRSIHRFDDLLDVSAVTYPASPTTSIDVAARMLLEQPVESRARIRSLWAIAKDIRADQPVSAEDRTALADGLEALATGEELDPVEERDSGVGCGCCDACTAEAREAADETEERDQTVCPKCGGFGSCPDCGGSGKAGVDGTQSGVDPSPSNAQDGTGSRKSDAPRLQLAIEMMKLRRPLER